MPPATLWRLVRNDPNRHGWMILRGRLEGEPGDVFLPADVRGQDQVEVVDGLLAL